ncbi:MAG TPA: type II toxin-antitoxin system HipA family toxin [Desulfuromonadales bacterium]|nr:type II toxin-antitoxin system HipA family toxin [Desulfuromonadales bacterium]
MPGVAELAVWAGAARSGLLAREAHNRHIFAYSQGYAGDVVSLTMPVRLESWACRELHPVFQMNLPEGALLEAIRKAIAKLIGDDDLSLLRVTGGNQVGRNRFSVAEADYPTAVETMESLEELLSFPDTVELFQELVNRYALRSGVSGVQPKVLLGATQRGTLASAQYIVKSWGSEYPQLAANEYFCMTVAKRAGLPTPEFYLAENGGLFVMRRFDRDEDGTELGFEEICALQGLSTSRKYSGSYERVARSIKDFVSGEHLMAARKQFFAMLVLSVMVRNGDAHLKNFGVLYRSSRDVVTLAPVYDVVTTAAYIQKDVPALTLAGTKKWWHRNVLEQFAMTHLSLSVGMISDIFEQMSTATMEVRGEIASYCGDHPEFTVVGERMMDIWQEGVEGLRK